MPALTDDGLGAYDAVVNCSLSVAKRNTCCYFPEQVCKRRATASRLSVQIQQLIFKKLITVKREQLICEQPILEERPGSFVIEDRLVISHG